MHNKSRLGFALTLTAMASLCLAVASGSIWLLESGGRSSLEIFVALLAIFPLIVSVIGRGILLNALERLSLTRTLLLVWFSLTVALYGVSISSARQISLDTDSGRYLAGVLGLNFLTLVAQVFLQQRKRTYAPLDGVYQRTADQFGVNANWIATKSEGILLAPPDDKRTVFLQCLYGDELASAHRIDFSRALLAMLGFGSASLYAAACANALYLSHGARFALPAFPMFALLLLAASHLLFLCMQWVRQTPVVGDSGVHAPEPTQADISLNALCRSMQQMESMVRSIERNNTTQLNSTQDLLSVLTRLVERMHQNQHRGTDTLEASIRLLVDKLDHLDRQVALQERQADTLMRLVRKLEHTYQR
ncbi:MAG: hypothetical protein KGM99_05205 [Burkholderiales bacterium]|nr:hypothetical protein [Burkholderiales bacterium]